MKMKKWFGLLILGLALIVLAACGQKSPEDIIKTELKDSYSGSSELRAYESFFNSGGDRLKFDPSKEQISNSNGEVVYFKTVPKSELPSQPSGVLTSLEEELDNTDNFTIVISSRREQLDTSDSYYQVSLSEGGKTIRIIELRRNHFTEGGFYDFSGESK